MLQQDDAAYVKGLSVLAGLEPSVAELICQHCDPVHYPVHQAVFREGEPAKEMLVVLSGSLGVFKQARCGNEVQIATLGQGAVVGEMSLVDIQPRSADVRALEPTSAAVLPHAAIGTLHREHPEAYTLLVLNIAREISIRLRHLDTMLANVLGELSNVVDAPLR